METTIKIEGMMCPHCEGRVKKALESIDGVSETVVSHTAGNAKITHNESVSVDTLKKAVEEAGYKVI